MGHWSFTLCNYPYSSKLLPGKNWLGGMLTELTQKLLQQNADNEVVNEGEGDGDVINNGELEMQAEDYDHNLHTVTR